MRPTYITFPEGVTPERPYSLFALYYNDEMIQSIVSTTNLYTRVVGEGEKALGRDWYNTTPQEIFIYLALRIYITVHVENEIDSYWSTSSTRPSHPIIQYLSKDRFDELHIRFRLGPDTSTTYSRVIHPPPQYFNVSHL